MSALESQLKHIVGAHPWVRIHPNSPSGPHVLAVLWETEDGLLGQALWDKTGRRWVVRCFAQTAGDDSLAVENPESSEGISAAITSVIARVRLLRL